MLYSFINSQLADEIKSNTHNDREAYTWKLVGNVSVNLS